MKNEKIKKKLKESYLAKYGVDNPMKNEKIKEKQKINSEKHFLTKYGCNSISQINITNFNDWKFNFITVYKNCLGDINFLKKYFNVSYSRLCAKIRSEINKINEKYESFFEKEIKFFLDKLKINYIGGKRKLLDNIYQIDLFLPDHNIALECNGLFWHCEVRGIKNKNYHLNKTIKCNEKNIHLIHIWEHLWNEKKEIYWSIIKSHLGLNEKIYARKCAIVEVDKCKAREFYNMNHIQGSVGSSVHIGLKYCGDLVAMMSFGKSRFSKKYEYEMTRYCCAIGKNIIGGAGRLFKYFIDKCDPSSIVAYSDRSIFSGNMYHKLGFKFSGYSEPNYWYTNDHYSCYSRIKFQKHKLAELVESYDSNLTEWENMKNNGWDRYWDCGNGVWKWAK